MNQIAELIAKIKEAGSPKKGFGKQELSELSKGSRLSKILLQLPTGLRNRSAEISEAIRKELGCEVLIAGNPCYGACDLPVEEAKQSGTDLIVHVGHKPFYRKIETPVPVVYYDWPMEVKLDEQKLLKEIAKVKEGRIGLISTVQFTHLLPKIQSLAESVGKEATIGGYVLGCWTEAADKLKGKVDALVFVGSGMFHPLGFDCTYVLDIEKHEISDITETIAKFEKLRWGRILKAKDARTFGILVTSKPGQHELVGGAEAVKTKLEAAGKKALILIIDEISESALSAFDCDAFVNTACPRIEDDRWSRPLINAQDVDKILEN